MLKKLPPMIVLVLLFSQAVAQPFSLRSTGEAKPFQLEIYFGTEGKGAVVQYRGQQGIIPLQLKSRTVQDKTGQSKVTYLWEEVVGGKVTGTYGLTQESEKVSGIWYKRNRDGKRFKLEHAPDQQGYERIGKYLLHGVLISFRYTTDNLLIFSYPDGSTKTSQLPSFDHPDPQRKGTIADYNFDGYDDVAFSIPDGGMGVYRTYSIYLYNRTSKQFQILAEPNAPKAKCTGFCDVTLDKKNKLFITACRGAATWWKDVYKFSHNNNLIWVSSAKASTK
ncbi:hypothetical protein FA048_15700 [Pedobacter polaris]|uniref:VCBS repeat-containing protein n=1 Tax=Pedobacter polaris TaxID=2571273 RepID=A0A4U1CIC9_9SPHI|nr:hypothetical protein [Pedobacter polaris]TKC06648.1 hypothetical protein FA048_15700 [Pedobacter polaris]